MVSCRECNDRGFYTILNAWDPDYSEEIRCEYCSGVPKVKVTNVREKVSDKRTS